MFSEECLIWSPTTTEAPSLSEQKLDLRLISDSGIIFWGGKAKNERKQDVGARVKAADLSIST